jgi:hypothetical protein
MPFYTCIQRVPGPNCREDFNYTVDFGDFPQFLLANSDIASIRPQALLPHPSPVHYSLAILLLNTAFPSVSP